MLDPFQKDNILGVHVSPFGVIPKSERGKWQLIVNLSSPERGIINNDGIHKDWNLLSYLSVDQVVQRVVFLGRRTRWKSLI